MTPELAAEVIQSERTLELEILTPMQPINFRLSAQTVAFRRDRIPVMQQGEYVWAVVAGLAAGTREQAGCFYWLRYVDPEGREHYIRDPLAYSLPYGVFAPAELYDIERLQRERADLPYLHRTSIPGDDIPAAAAHQYLANPRQNRQPRGHGGGLNPDLPHHFRQAGGG